MKTLGTASCALLVFALVAAPPVQAQTPWELGPTLGVNLESNEILLGAVSRIHLTSSPITLNPGFEFYPGIDDTGGGLSRSLFVLNLDVQYELEAESVEPYVGGGISWARASIEGLGAASDAGLNVKGGMTFSPSSRGQPFLEAILNFSDGTESLIIKGGFLFEIGR